MQNSFKNIGIIYNQEMQEAYALALEIKSKLENSEIYSIDEISSSIDLALIVGGDGSFLRTARFCASKNIPILGFNVGRLGFLTQAKPNDIDEVIKKLKNNDFTIEKRLMLSAKNNVALNDIVVKGACTNRTSTLHLYINDKELCSYVSDGLIISTPTGSTAYSLSAGGPIISPELNCFLIVPICPHTLNTRPIIIPKTEKITIKTFETNNKLNISYDGQVNIALDDEITIQKSDLCANLVILNQQKDKFYDILKEKLHWSVAPKK